MVAGERSRIRPNAPGYDRVLTQCAIFYGTGSTLQTLAELAPAPGFVEPFVRQADQRDTLDRVSASLRTMDPEL